MSNIDLIIEERAIEIGNFMVGRLLPFRQKRSVGPFVYVDHMGPAILNEQTNLDVLPHPHIGLATLTYLFEGSIMHRDSMGNEVEIKPGAVNWMTAGKGVVHSERTPQNLRQTNKKLHGMQIWVALPKELEDILPAFVQVSASDIPSWTLDGANIKLIAGEAFGKKSPVPVHSKLYFIKINTHSPQKINPGNGIYGESALYILDGKVSIEGNIFGPGQLLVARNSKLCMFEMAANTTVCIFGGEPLPEPRFIDWNFVSSSKERLQQAREDWLNQRFPPIKGETEFMPYPGQRP